MGFAVGGSVFAKESFDIPAASQNTQNRYIVVFDFVENYVIPDRKTPQPDADHRRGDGLCMGC